MIEKRISVVISGSFKFKREIDLAREEFEDLGTLVLDPPKGGIIKTREDGFSPLLEEIHLPIEVIENSFLYSIRRSDLLYIVNIDGYIGEVVGMEIGFTKALKKPMFAKRPFNISAYEQDWYRETLSAIPIKTPQEAITQTRKHLEETQRLYLLK